ncbi:hypothetical protein TNCV_2753821 [Trichonephila clavipes]|nr:hypothetical protein TNCV_2753821 [Trichonephila clavipes]
MNSPDYNDFIDMFSVPTPISPLPPTPVASQSHEPSQDAIYDSLPPLEQSMVPESPLKDLLPVEQSRVSESPLKDPVDSKPPNVSKSPEPPVKMPLSRRLIPSFILLRDPGKEEMRKDGTMNEEVRNEGNETPGCVEGPNSDPRIEGMISKPECFGDPTFKENVQVFFYSQGLALLCIRNKCFPRHGSGMSKRTV